MESLPPQRSRRSRIRIQREVLNISGVSAAAQNKSYSFNFKKDSALAKMDPLVEKGRVFWNKNRSQLGKWQAKEGDWAFFPKMHGTPSHVKKCGIQSVHFAVGYKEFGQMVNTYGKIASEWPPLPSTITTLPPPAVINLMTPCLVTPISGGKITLNAKVRSLEQLAFEDGQARDGLLVARIKDLEDYVFDTSYTPPSNLSSRVDALVQEFE
mmetsp:Transcript_16026/g.18974  ORF Transcript_16026/g.18974 Transcript_16026/m.18974 type:complete len:211 (-) Transcript_16026:93-725(-)